MNNHQRSGVMYALCCIAILLMAAGFPEPAVGAPAAAQAKVLQEMSWVDVRDYLKTSDMVLIPMGSTEQHGPHLPLGTDFYEAMGAARMISERTGILVAPVVMSGYSVYHSGFPGSLSLKPETMTQVLYETAEILIQYGFRRILFFNYHGGNNIVQQTVIHRINHETEAVAVAVGHGSSIMKETGGVPGDMHGGVNETSLMLYFHPELVRMDRAEKPVMRYTERSEKLRAAAADNPILNNILDTLLGVPVETKKGGASHELSSNGIWSFRDPREANVELGRKMAETMVDQVVRFIEAWRKIEGR